MGQWGKVAPILDLSYSWRWVSCSGQ